MGTISLSIPQTGQPNSTEDPKVATDLTTIQTVINGNLDDTNLFSPNNGVRRLLLQNTGIINNNVAAGTYLFSPGGNAVASGGNVLPDVWAGDTVPQYAVANKTSYAQLRVTGGTNSVSVGTVNFVFGLYQAGYGGSSNSVAVTAVSLVGGSTVTFANPATSNVFGGSSAQFALPTAAAGYVIACVTNATIPVNAALMFTAQLVAYNA